MISVARSPRYARRLLVGVAVIAFGLSATACGSDDDETSSTAAASDESGEETEVYEIVPDAEVAAGLNATVADADALVARIGSGATNEDFEAVFEGWEAYEGTVKQNETETYLAIEDALSLLKNAVEDEDAAAGATAFADLQAAADSYLERHP